MGAGTDVYELIYYINDFNSNQAYLHKMFRSMHMQVIVIEINTFCIYFSH